MSGKTEIGHHDLTASSETGDLRKVLIHRPDEGIERVTPSRALDLLYEDIVFLPRMREEHDVFTESLRFFLGSENVYDVQHLLADILYQSEIKKRLVSIICKLEGCGKRIEDFLLSLDPSTLASALITGIINEKKKIAVFFPLPNLIFARDLATIINDHLVLAQASRKARSRESVLCYFIFHHHELFRSFHSEGRIIGLSNGEDDLLHNNNSLLGQQSFEGGDLMILSPDHVLISSSERSTDNAIKRITENLFSKKAVRRITLINLPKLRFCMHLDTVFTMISRNQCVAFKPIVMDGKNTEVFQFTNGRDKAEKFSSLQAALIKDNSDLEFIPCGEGKFPFDEREQWTDGCNLFAIREGVAYAYDRNVRTNHALQEKGYSIRQVSELIKEFKSGNLKSDDIRNTIITLPSSELSRARGGPHCLTMPLQRV